MTLPPDHDARLALARRSLEGLSVGDAFGEQFFVDVALAAHRIQTRTAPGRPGSWWWTDDTAMAISVVDVLAELGTIDVDALAAAFAARYRLEPARGYGGGAHQLFGEVLAGKAWRDAAGQLFEGMGSFGNGGAMRVAPLGAYFHDDLDRVVVEASRSAEPTHHHPEGRAGAVAIAVAAALAQQIAGGTRPRDGAALIAEVRRSTPRGQVRDGIGEAEKLLHLEDARSAARVLGNGSSVSAQDTVPFCLWAIARHLDDYEQALWTTVTALGDRDTTCAIVGGVVALSAPAIPEAWLAAREALPTQAPVQDGGAAPITVRVGRTRT
jgi:ADP-ribosylglycohydrolase